MARRPGLAAAQETFRQTMLMQPSVVARAEVPNLVRSQRINRRPYEDFFVRHRPWEIQPVAFHPVIPGETLLNMQMQSRAVTSPVKANLSGWWLEYYLFYVKHSDLEADWPAIQDMHLTGAATGLEDTTRRNTYYKFNTDSRLDWVSRCTEACVKWYFRDGGEPLAGYGNYGLKTPTNGGNVYLARARDPMWLESVKIEDVNPSGQGDLPGVEDFNDTFIPAAWANHYAQWEHMRQVKLIPEDVSFEDYLETFGVKAPEQLQETIHRPELIRYLRHWQYPSNTVNTTSGNATAAVSWAINARADKPRYFAEPGFLIMLSVARPKVFFANQVAHASSMLDDPYSWLPAIMRENAFTSVKEYDHNEGPLSGVFNSADDYWVDQRDLFVRGGQFLNCDPSTEPDMPKVALPKVAGADNDINLWYAAESDQWGLFVDDDNSDGATVLKQDGIVRFNIKSHEHVARDQT